MLIDSFLHGKDSTLHFNYDLIINEWAQFLLSCYVITTSDQRV